MWPLLLAAVYLALIPLLAGLEDVQGVTYLLLASAAGCLLVWVVRYPTGRKGFLDTGKGFLETGKGLPETGKELLKALNDWRLDRPHTNLGPPPSRTVSLPAPRERPHSRRVRLLAPLDLAIDALRRLPLVVLWLPLPASLSWTAGMMARVPPAKADYYLAFELWLVALILFVAFFLVPLVVENWEKLPTLVRALPWREVGAVAFITGVAFVARFVLLASEPGPFSRDEPPLAFAALQVANGAVRNLFDMGVGVHQSGMFNATMALPFKLFGTSILTARLSSAIIGTVTIPLFYLMLREMFDRRVALVGAALMAVLHVDVHYSRIAMLGSTVVFLTVLMVYFGFRAIRTRALVDFALTGLAAGVAMYFHASLRVVPLVLVLVLALMVVKTRGAFILRNFWGLATLLTGFVIAVLPAALFFDGTSGPFSARFEEVSIFGSGNWLEVQRELTGHSDLHLIWDRVQQAFGSLVIYPGCSTNYCSEVPRLDAVSGALLVIGGVYALFHLYQPRFLALFALLVLPLIIGGALIRPPIQDSRLLATAPATAAFVALGAVVAAEAVATAIPRWRAYAPVAVGAVVVLIAIMNLSFYFGTFIPSERYAGGFHTNEIAIGQYLEQFDESYAVYVFAPVPIHIAEIRFLARDKVMVQASATYLPGMRTGLLPFQDEDIAAAAKENTPNALALVAFDQTGELYDLVLECASLSKGVTLDVVRNAERRPLLLSYKLPGAQPCLEQVMAARS